MHRFCSEDAVPHILHFCLEVLRLCLDVLNCTFDRSSGSELSINQALF